MPPASQPGLHQEAIAKKDSKIAMKSREYIQLSTLAQDRQKELNTAMPQCDSKIAAMEDQCQLYQQEADEKVAATESGACKTLRTERAFLHSKLVQSNRMNAETVDLLKKSQVKI